MASLSTEKLKPLEAKKIVNIEESHFVDIKSIEISPSKLTKTLSAFANAEGGEIYIGIDEISKQPKKRSWRGFPRIEDANSFLQTFEEFFPLGEEHIYNFLVCDDEAGFVLKVEVRKSRSVKTASDSKPYIRRGAQSLPVSSEDGINRLRRNKGITSFETETLSIEQDIITNSDQIIKFMLEVVPAAEPEIWLKKQQVIINEKPTVGGLILFSDEPQAALPKHCGLKIYRYKTRADEGTRESLDFDPISIEGCAYDQIFKARQVTTDVIESVRINTPKGLESVKYPTTALHEIITNAVIHRDYSIADDIHIRIFDNRVEVLSPGNLPAHITPANILEERFARNGGIVRLINKFPDPPNKDVGEGLNTAFAAMREMKLKSPIISHSGGYVKVVLRHEPLATPEELILEFLETHDKIKNSQAREICFIGSENVMKRILQRMVAKDIIELVPGRTRYTSAYQLKL